MYKYKNIIKCFQPYKSIWINKTCAEWSPLTVIKYSLHLTPGPNWGICILCGELTNISPVLRIEFKIYKRKWFKLIYIVCINLICNLFKLLVSLYIILKLFLLQMLSFVLIGIYIVELIRYIVITYNKYYIYLFFFWKSIFLYIHFWSVKD